MAQSRHRHRITDSDEVLITGGVSTLSPPPSIIELVKDNPRADAEWKKWLNNFYEYVGLLTSQVVGMQSIKFGDSPSIDAFARARVSNPETIFDSKQIHDKQPLFWDEALTLNGTAPWTQAAASTMMTVTTTADAVARQTFRRFNYQPGKSQLILMTFVLDESGGGTGITREVGMYDANNGIFLQDSAGTINLVKRNATSDTTVAQASWNIDVFDGTGTSGKTLDWTKSQIMLIDMEWLGVGRVRIGFVIDGIPYYAHQFVHANTTSGVYMSTPNLPLRYYIENAAGAGVQSTLEHICCSVMSEGGTQDVGATRVATSGSVFVNANTANTTYAIVGIRLDTDHLDGVAKIIGVSLLEAAATSVDYEWKLIYDPTVANTANFSTAWTDVATGSSFIEYAVGDNSNPSTNTVTGGTVIASGFVAAGGSKTSSNSDEVDTTLLLGSTIAGVSKQIWLCVTPKGTNADVYGSISWKEIS